MLEIPSTLANPMPNYAHHVNHEESKHEAIPEVPRSVDVGLVVRVQTAGGRGAAMSTTFATTTLTASTTANFTAVVLLLRLRLILSICKRKGMRHLNSVRDKLILRTNCDRCYRRW